MTIVAALRAELKERDKLGSHIDYPQVCPEPHCPSVLQIKMSKHFKDTGVETQGLRSLHCKRGREKLALYEGTQQKRSGCSNVTSMSVPLNRHNLNEGARLTLSVPQVHRIFP